MNTTKLGKHIPFLVLARNGAESQQPHTNSIRSLSVRRDDENIRSIYWRDDRRIHHGGSSHLRQRHRSAFNSKTFLPKSAVYALQFMSGKLLTSLENFIARLSLTTSVYS
jgi:hypothetical protein